MTSPDVTSTTPASVDVAIVGAGLSGLSAAWHLQQMRLSTKVLEASDHIGGLARTTEEQGYRFDQTGHLLHLRDEQLLDRVERWLGHPLHVLKRQSRVWSHGVYTHYPFQANTFGLPSDIAHACLSGFVDASLERARRGETDEMTRARLATADFETFCREIFGDGICEHFMLPYNRKLWGVEPRELSSAWTSRFVPIPHVDDVVAGAVGHARRELGYNARFLYPRLGMGALPDALGRHVQNIETDAEVVAIDPDRHVLRTRQGELGYGALVSTMPLPVLIERLSDAPEDVRGAAEQLRFTSLYYLDVALSTPVEKPFHWVYVPAPEVPFYRVGSYSNFSTAMAPPNKGSLYVELATREPPDLGSLLPEVAERLVEMGLIRHPHAIRFARVRRIPHAYVIYDANYEQARSVIHDYLSQQQIISVGRYGDWNYSSMEDALVFGERASEQAASWARRAVSK